MGLLPRGVEAGDTWSLGHLGRARAALLQGLADILPLLPTALARLLLQVDNVIWHL